MQPDQPQPVALTDGPLSREDGLRDAEFHAFTDIGGTIYRKNHPDHGVIYTSRLGYPTDAKYAWYASVEQLEQAVAINISRGQRVIALDKEDLQEVRDFIEDVAPALRNSLERDLSAPQASEIGYSLS